MVLHSNLSSWYFLYRPISIHGNAETQKCFCVKDTHMAGLVGDHQGIVRGCLIQKVSVRMGSLLQKIVVISLSCQPFPLLHMPDSDIFPHPFRNFPETFGTIQGNLQFPVGAGHKMAVSIQKGGHHGPPLQIHPFCVRTGTRLHSRLSSHCRYPAVLYKYRLRVHLFFHCQDDSVRI